MNKRCIVLGLLAGALSAVLPAAAGAAGASYVAMGDSYTAGPGIAPASPTAPADCAQSALNYPHLVASALNLSLTDVSCSGAATKDFTQAQFEDQPPQFDALGPSTEVVTIGMGGNDHNLFSSLLTACTELDIAKPEGAPCKQQEAKFVKQTFAEDVAPAVQALEEVHELAPNAKVFVVGYPQITPATGSCPADFPWTAGDIAWFHKSVQKKGNAALKREAKAHGAIYVDTFGPSMGHDACQEVGTRWIEPIFGSLTGVPVHPNALGEENDAFDVERAMLDHGVR
jgi:hypothetical protein